jgi:hypothetical protein
VSSKKSPKGDFFFREGGRGEPPYPPYHKNLGCQGEIAKPGCQGKSFDANFLEKDLASLGSSAYAVRMNNKIDTNSDLRDLIFMRAEEVAEMNTWCDELREACFNAQDEMEQSWDRLISWVDSL